jgi:adenylate cyclase
MSQLFFQEKKIGYIVVDSKFTVLESGGHLAFLAQATHTPSTSLFHWLPELEGCDTLLEEVLEGQSPNFELENLNRISPRQQTYYLHLTVTRYMPTAARENTPLLLCLLEDTTESTLAQQALIQRYNELNLIKGQLDNVNKHLEFVLSRYVPKEVGQALVEQKMTPELGGKVKEITVLFVDLRNYTSISESSTPGEIMDLLRTFLDVACGIIAQLGGVVVNYMGDAVMAIFNAPTAQPDHAQRAVQAALKMQAMAEQLRQEYQDDALVASLHFGVGINTGVAFVGNMGAEWHCQYTAIGDTVNVASRICGQARAGEVLIGASTQAALPANVKTKVLPSLKLKGKAQNVTVYRVDEVCEVTSSAQPTCSNWTCIFQQGGDCVNSLFNEFRLESQPSCTL